MDGAAVSSAVPITLKDLTVGTILNNLGFPNERVLGDSVGASLFTTSSSSEGDAVAPSFPNEGMGGNPGASA
ncbi:MAG: hypothetical protein COV48_06195 [Elusimicrobia bacterium CG11_big_fil_rev_8_21_14_0_20_64_6]|nr:MAG: hypothetical protein COV48_06195 [Elusimicrobia bacterium CG11_big_fil_rev_8_21_14_0_20_64_6]